MRYLVQSRDQIFAKGYGFLFFAKNIDKNISKNLSGKCSKKLLDHAKQSATGAFNTTSKKAIQKTAEATGDLIGNKNANKITKAPKAQKYFRSGFKQNRYTWRKIYISPEKREQIIDKLRLIK